MAHASHAVVDTTDGYTWVRDADDTLFDEERARALADRWNGHLKPEFAGRFQVFRLVPAGEVIAEDDMRKVRARLLGRTS